MEQRKKRTCALLLVTMFSLVLTGCNQQDIINAGYNTLLGMGMAFALLILISLVISLFPLIGKISEGKKSKKEKQEEMRLKSIDKTISHIEQQESSQGKKEAAAPLSAVSIKALSGGNAEEEAVAAIAAAIAASEEEGPELIAVISAAIAAYEAESGSSQTQVIYGPARRRQIAVPQGYQGFYVRSIRKIGHSQWKNS